MNEDGGAEEDLEEWLGENAGVDGGFDVLLRIYGGNKALG
jgi:hypothetical protein